MRRKSLLTAAVVSVLLVPVAISKSKVVFAVFNGSLQGVFGLLLIVPEEAQIVGCNASISVNFDDLLEQTMLAQ